MRLIITGTLPNLNDYVFANRTNRFAGAKLKSDVERRILWHIRSQKLGHIDKKIKLVFSWYEPNRKRDMDNVAFAKKFILDALQKANVIDGDGWKFVSGFEDKFYIDKTNPRIEVEIEDAESL